MDHGRRRLARGARASCGRRRSSGRARRSAGAGLDQLAKYCEWDELPNLRRVVVDMVEEYARHTGHADLIRESIDGLVGEDAASRESAP